RRKPGDLRDRWLRKPSRALTAATAKNWWPRCLRTFRGRPAAGDPALRLLERALHLTEGLRIAASIGVGGESLLTKCALQVAGRRDCARRRRTHRVCERPRGRAARSTRQPT